MNPSEAKDELSENIYPYGIITSKGSDERRHFPPPECQRRSLLRTLNHHSANVKPFACGAAVHSTCVKCEWGKWIGIWLCTAPKTMAKMLHSVVLFWGVTTGKELPLLALWNRTAS